MRNNQNGVRYPRGVMVKALDRGIVASEFELQTRFYVHFDPPNNELHSITAVLLEGWL